MRLIGFAIAFVVGGFGAVGSQHLMDPGLATALGALLAGGLGEVARRHVPPSKAS